MRNIFQLKNVLLIKLLNSTCATFRKMKIYHLVEHNCVKMSPHINVIYFELKTVRSLVLYQRYSWYEHISYKSREPIGWHVP